MPRQSIQQAAATLGVSTTTIRRRIDRGELEIEREGGGHSKIWVIVPDELARDSDDVGTLRTALAVSEERNRNLEGLIAKLQEDLQLERDRYYDLRQDLTAVTRMLPPPDDRETYTRRPWWRRLVGG